MLSEITSEYNEIKYLYELLTTLIEYTDKLRNDSRNRERIYNDFKDLRRYKEDERDTVDNNDIIYISLFNLIDGTNKTDSSYITWDKIFKTCDSKLKLDDESISSKDEIINKLKNNIQIVQNL